jgi:signal transduction histidine kinase
VLSVTDSGCGIPQENLERVFEPFFSTKGDQGNGLGLPAVLSIVEQHGGRLEVHSALGDGTTFRLIFPGTLPRGAQS